MEEEKGTITVDPSQVRESGRVTVGIDYQPQPADVLPNDYHVEYQREGSNVWIKVRDGKADNADIIRDGWTQTAPNDGGTYTVRVRWTRDGREIGRATTTLTVEGGCFITTAAYGSTAEQELAFLHDIRDNLVKQTHWGKRFFDEYDQMYYRFSPQIAKTMLDEPRANEMIKWAFVIPWISFVKLAIKRPTDWKVDKDNVELAEFLEEIRDDVETWIRALDVPEDFTGLDNKAIVDELNIALNFIFREHGSAYLDRLAQKGVLPLHCESHERNELELTLRTAGRSDDEIARILP